MTNTQMTHDVAVVGAGSAGLQAAQTLGRMRQSVVVLGTDRYRNDPATHMHNFLGHDGTPPAELRTAAHKDAEQYATVELREVGVTRIDGTAGDFTLHLEDDSVVRARRVLLATGVVDDLPDIPGVADLFGDLVAHCPFCHGHEFADGPIGYLGSGAHVPVMAAMLGPIASEVVVLTDGDALDPEAAAALGRLGATVHTEKVAAARPGPGGLTVDLAVDLEAGGSRVRSVELAGLFVKTDWRQATPFAEQLGLAMSPVGAVVVDALGRTSLPGVYAAGDMAQGPELPQPMASVLTAAAAGLVAAAACVQDAAIERAQG